MSESNIFQFEIMTPNHTIYRDQVSFITAPSVDGPLGILKRHMPIIAQLVPGVVQIKDTNNQTHDFPIAGGLLSVADDVVTIFLSV